MQKYDIVVVGGGPGGTTAAKTAAEKGMKVLVIERGKEIGDKIYSGCGLFPKMFRDFPYTKTMNLPQTRISRGSCLAYFEPPPSLKLVSHTISFPSNRLYDEAKEYTAQTVYMKEFVGYLANLAKDAGAEFRMATLVTDVLRKVGKITGVLTDKGEEIQSDIVIAADGVLSLMARKAGLRKKWDPRGVVNIASLTFSAPREKLDEFTEDYAVAVYSVPGWGGWYHVCYRDGFHIGGLGFPLTIGKRVELRRGVVADYLRLFEVPYVKNMLKRLEAKPIEFSMHPLTWFDELTKEIYTDGLMLVGDAAGVPEPFLASGVYEAMVSGRLAAEVAVEAIEKGDTSRGFLKEYYDRLEASPVGQEFQAGKQLRAMFDFMLTDPDGAKLREVMTDVRTFLMGAMSGTVDPFVISPPKAIPVLLENMPVLLKALGLFLPALTTALSEPVSGVAKILASMMKGVEQ